MKRNRAENSSGGTKLLVTEVILAYLLQGLGNRPPTLVNV